MKVLIIGKGGRCHALAWKISQSQLNPKIYLAPGNAGTQKDYNNIKIEETDLSGLLEFALSEKIDLTIVGPEVPLMMGIVDLFLANNLKIFGPTKEAAQIEGSKNFAKALMKKYHIPTASYAHFSNYEEALSYINNHNYPLVIKYDGLAAGKGVVIADSLEEADITIKSMLLDHKFGNGDIIIEDFLSGPEFSLMALVNHDKVYPLAIAQDHKRAFNGDVGPNTGGMGAYSPVPIISDDIVNQAVEEIMKPIAKAMVEEGLPFTGVLYGGLMLTKEGVKVIEFNARFGDPETEVVLPRIKSDLLQIIIDLLDNKPVNIEWNDIHTLGVVIAAEGYPDEYKKGIVIPPLGDDLIFHMGTIYKDNVMVNNGGRVLIAVGQGNNLQDAYNDAYQIVNKVKCKYLFNRSDIGYQVIKNHK